MPKVMEAIDKMSAAEKVNTMEYIWNALTAHYAASVPDWHRDVLEARRKKIEAGEVEYYTIDETEAWLEKECRVRHKRKLNQRRRRVAAGEESFISLEESKRRFREAVHPR